MKVEVEGLEIEVSDESLINVEISWGDLYVGKRNQGWQLGTFSYISEEGYVFDADHKLYPYNASECRKVVRI